MGKENIDESDKPMEPARTSKVEAPGPTPSLTILTIDDDPGMLRFYEAALVDEDVQVTSSTDPLRGVELAETGWSDLLGTCFVFQRAAPEMGRWWPPSCAAFG